MLEQPLYEEHPVMFRAHPIVYLFFIAMIPVFGLGLIMLFGWWLQCLGTRVTVSNKRIFVRRGILSKHTNEVYHEHVRNIRVNQPLLQRLFSVGSIQVASAGAGYYEMSVADLPRPQEIKDLVDSYRN